MKYLTIFFICFTSFVYSQRPIGINIAEVSDYSTELVFTDAFKQCRTWIPHEDDFEADWDSGVSIPLNTNGYPLEIPYDNGTNPPQIVRTLLLTNLGGNYSSGEYRLIVEGSGQISFWGGLEGTYTTPIDTMITINASNNGIVMELEQSLVSDPISSIKLIYPEYVNTYQTQEYSDDFLDFLDGFESIRFMDWLKTNESVIENWNERSLPEYYTQTTEGGVAWEKVIELCNLTQKNAWINIPHLATDDYMTQLAQLINTNLDTNLTFYLEYSNELWNGGTFQQFHDLVILATDLGYTGEDWEKVWKYTAKRSADLFYIFETVLGDSNRFVKVLPTQMSGYITEQIVTNFNNTTYNPNQVTADAVAMAPYFGGAIGDALGDSGDYTTITVTEILDLAEDSLEESVTEMNEVKAIATTNNLNIIAYEGGQHLVGNGVNADLDVLTDKLIAANRDSRMENIYCQYFDNWYNTLSGGLFAVYASHGTPSRYGSWGIKEYMADVDAPKYNAVENCVFSYNTVNTNDLSKELVSIFPNPNDGFFTINHSLDSPVFKAFDVLGKEVNIDILANNRFNIDAKGILFLKISNKDTSVTVKLVAK